METIPTPDGSVRLAVRADAVLGEGPVWSAAENALYWVDIKNPRLFRHDLARGETRATPMPEPIGAVALCSGGGLVAALRSGFALIDAQGKAGPVFARPETDLPDNRFNDGKCDRAGRFWAASMDDRGTHPTGHLYRLSNVQDCARMESGFVIGNGLGWSPDNRVFYFTDSVARRIYAYDFAFDTGAIANRRVFATVPDDAGFPDGLCVDAAGHVWSAHWDGWRITRYAPDGKIVDVLRMPVPRPTSCCFGGPGLDVLFVTSARIDLDAATLTKAPWSGSVLAVATNSRGLPEAAFHAR